MILYLVDLISELDHQEKLSICHLSETQEFKSAYFIHQHPLQSQIENKIPFAHRCTHQKLIVVLEEHSMFRLPLTSHKNNDLYVSLLKDNFSKIFGILRKFCKREQFFFITHTTYLIQIFWDSFSIQHPSNAQGSNVHIVVSFAVSCVLESLPLYECLLLP